MAGVCLTCWCAAFLVFNGCRFTTSDTGAAVMASAYVLMAVLGAASLFFALIGW